MALFILPLEVLKKRPLCSRCIYRYIALL